MTDYIYLIYYYLHKNILQYYVISHEHTFLQNVGNLIVQLFTYII